MAKISFNWPIGERQVIRQTLYVETQGLKDMRPVWDKFIPYIRRRNSVTFRQQSSPFGEPWPALDPAYAKRKRKKWGNKPILVASGELKRAASVKGASGQFLEMEPSYMTFTVIRLAGWFNVGRLHQQGGKFHPRRTWLGLKLPDDLIALKAYVDRYLRLLKGKSSAIGRGSA